MPENLADLMAWRDPNTGQLHALDIDTGEIMYAPQGWESEAYRYGDLLSEYADVLGEYGMEIPPDEHIVPLRRAA